MLDHVESPILATKDPFFEILLKYFNEKYYKLYIKKGCLV